MAVADEAVIRMDLRGRETEYYRAVADDLLGANGGGTRTAVDREHPIALTANALLLLRNRFLLVDSAGEPLETPTDLFWRVAGGVAAAEPDAERRQRWASVFYRVMADMQFHPGSRVLANAGTDHPQVGNCFVFPLADSQEQILRTFMQSSLIKGHGGGCGFNYSAIRPRGDSVRGTLGLAGGPVGLIHLFDMSTGLFRQRGRYESGNMAILNVDHPDILEFIEAKRMDGVLSLTNISLGVTDRFMQAVESDESWSLLNPRTSEVWRTLPARDIFAAACEHAVTTGDPGLVFLDAMNRNNPLQAALGDIVATNPCGEIGLYPYESCNLGYLDLPRFMLARPDFYSGPVFDTKKLERVVAVAIRMMDDAVSATWSPIPQITEIVQANRRLGLGVTGWADVLTLAGIPYDSERALAVADELGAAMRRAAFAASLALAREKGPFPNVVNSIWRNEQEQPRNVALLALPPSGNNAIIFDSSFGIEPHFALAYHENAMGGIRISSVNRHLLATLDRLGLQRTDLIESVEAANGSVQGLDWIPAGVRAVFKTAHDIAPEWHVKMQAAFQRHTDNAVSKTINFPRGATLEDVERAYMLAYRERCKGITVYRDRSRAGQTIEFSTPLTIEAADGGVCRTCTD